MDALSPPARADHPPTLAIHHVKPREHVSSLNRSQSVSMATWLALNFLLWNAGSHLGGQDLTREGDDNPNTVSYQVNNGKFNCPERTWTRADGSGTFRAALKRYGPGPATITLRLEDRSALELKTDELSDADQYYLTRLANMIAEQASSASSDFIMSGLKSSPSDNLLEISGLSSYKGSGNKLGSFSVVAIDAKKVPDFSLTDRHQVGQPNWLPRNLTDRNIAFSFPNDGSFLHSKATPITVSSDGRFAAVAINNEFAERSRVVLFDLAAGKVLTVHDLTEESWPLAFVPDGSVIAISHSVSTAERGSHDQRIFFWKVPANGGSLQFEKGWATEWQTSAGVFLDKERFVGAGPRTIAVYNVAMNRILYGSYGEYPVGLLGGGGYALVDRNDHRVIDLESGKAAVYKKTRSSSYAGNRAISVDGRLMACCSHYRTVVVDLANGNDLLEISNSNQLSVPVFVTNRFLLAGEHLYDLKLRALVAAVDFPDGISGVQATGDGRLAWVCRTDREKEKYTLVMSNCLTETLSNQIRELTAGPSLEIKNGTQVALKLRGVSTAVENAIRSHVASEGLVVSPDAELVIEAEVEQMASETIQVKEAGRLRADVSSVKFTPTISRCRFRWHDQVVTERSSTNRPPIVLRPGQGETAQTYVNRMCVPNPYFFTSGMIPTSVVLYKGKLPKLRFGPSGINLE